jgi:hypothetical protein
MRGHSIAGNTKPRLLRSFLPVVAVSVLLGGCAVSDPPSDAYLAAHGYWYQDGNHQGGSSGSASPQAKSNAIHGIWLWPPAEVDFPD